MKAVLKSAGPAVAMEGALEGARRATGSAPSSAAPTDPEVVAIARRRQFSPAEKRRILAAADRCMQPREIGALLRREGIYSSQLATWRKNRAAVDGGGRTERRRGRRADPKRFKHVAPRPPEVPLAAWINPPPKKESTPPQQSTNAL